MCEENRIDYVCPSTENSILDYKNCKSMGADRSNDNKMYPWLVTRDYNGCCFNVYSRENYPAKPATIGITQRFHYLNSDGDCSEFENKGTWQAWYLQNFNITKVVGDEEVHPIEDPVLVGVKVNCFIEFTIKHT